MIYKILNNEDTNDVYCQKFEKDKLPSFSVTRNGYDGSGVTYYLDNYIQVGDTYDDNEFLKTNHTNKNASGVTLQTYFENLCKEEISKLALISRAKDADDFKSKLKNNFFAEYMISDNGIYTVNGVKSISIDNVSFDGFVSSGLTKLVKAEANKLVKQYGCDLKYNVTLENINQSSTVQTESGEYEGPTGVEHG